MSLPRLLRDISDAPMDLAEHRRLHGESVARPNDRSLIDAIAQARLRGRGGGGFPLATKLQAVRDARGTPSVVVNGCEGEPLSAKDRLLLTRLPHLVIDGAVALARTVRGTEIRFTVDEFDLVAQETLERALDERPEFRRGRLSASVVPTPSGYVSGQESAIVRFQQDGIAKPGPARPRVTQRGIGRRPTLVCNAETAAHAALVDHRGAEWYCRYGTEDQPGTTLVTLSGAVARPAVYEIAYGTRVRDLVTAAGGPAEPIDAYLIGGYAGTWIEGAQADALRLSDAALQTAGGRLGAGVISALGASACAAAEMASVTRWMSAQSAGQCGPCVHGLSSIADTMAAIVAGTAGAAALTDLERWARTSRGRGACAHPDGVAQLVMSALALFGPDLLDHVRYGPCDACADAPALTLKPATTVIR